MQDLLRVDKTDRTEERSRRAGQNFKNAGECHCLLLCFGVAELTNEGKILKSR